MSKLSQLIAELCPNGVEYVPLDYVAEFMDGYAFTAKDFKSSGVYPIIKIGNIEYGKIVAQGSYTDKMPKAIKTEQVLQGGEILVGMSGSTGKTGYNQIKNALVNQRIAILRNKTNILNGYLKHLLVNNRLVNNRFEKYCLKKGTGPQNNISKYSLLNYIVPLPPISIQQEIVRILDSFTELSTVLSTVLSTELIARKKQYQYYRDTLLTFDNKNNALHNVQFIALEKLLKYKQPTQYIVASENYDNSYKTPVLTAGQSFILGYTDESNGIYQASKNNPAIIFDDFTTSFHWVDFNFKVKSSAMKILTSLESNLITFRYLYYIMKSINYQPASHSRQWISKYSKFKIPLPPLAEQQRIVDILDRFDTLVNNISIGIPAEIEARDKQYQYYRNKLLSFKRLKEEL